MFVRVCRRNFPASRKCEFGSRSGTCVERPNYLTLESIYLPFSSITTCGCWCLSQSLKFDDLCQDFSFHVALDSSEARVSAIYDNAGELRRGRAFSRTDRTTQDLGYRSFATGVNGYRGICPI